MVKFTAVFSSWCTARLIANEVTYPSTEVSTGGSAAMIKGYFGGTVYIDTSLSPFAEDYGCNGKVQQLADCIFVCIAIYGEMQCVGV